MRVSIVCEELSERYIVFAGAWRKCIMYRNCSRKCSPSPKAGRSEIQAASLPRSITAKVLGLYVHSLNRYGTGFLCSVARSDATFRPVVILNTVCSGVWENRCWYCYSKGKISWKLDSNQQLSNTGWMMDNELPWLTKRQTGDGL